MSDIPRPPKRPLTGYFRFKVIIIRKIIIKVLKNKTQRKRLQKFQKSLVRCIQKFLMLKKKKYKNQREKEMKIFEPKMEAYKKKYGKKDFIINKTRRRILMENMNLQKKVAKLEEKLQNKVKNIIHNNN